MSDPCVQGERLVTLETILEQVAETLDEQKQLGQKTYEVLAGLSVQGEQIKSLVMRIDKNERDIEEMFGRTRKVEAKVIEHSGYIIGEKEAKERHGKITGPVIAGLIVAGIIALCALAINMVDRHNYTQDLIKEQSRKAAE